MTEFRQALVHLAGHAVATSGFAPPGAKGVVVLAHGRINDLDHPALLAAARGAHQAGWASFRFNFPYRQRGDATPDSFAILTEIHASAADHALAEYGVKRLVLAGKSLGARTAVEALRNGTRVQGLLFLGYPLHPPEDKTALRDEPLYDLNLPLKIIQGDSDALCDVEILSIILARLAPAPQLTVIPGADHGFGVPGGDHDPPARTLEAIQKAVTAWLDSLD